MVSLGLIFIANLLRDQAKNHEDLERRIQELSGLQAVGQSLTSSLDIHLISEAIYREVSKLMPASNFYLALWNPETDEVSFPAVYENYLRVESQSRTSKRGLTEYVIQNKKPLLIENNVKATVESLDLTHFGKEAQSWLGVPILAGPQAIGMIAVQSYPIPNQIRKTFDQNHQEILSTIAAQASVAIQNAWLYTQTDKALARHVQELHSILNTTSDGILLLNLELKVIEINQSLCNMLNIFPGTLINKSIPTDKDNPFSSLYIEPALLEILSDQSLKSQKNVVTLRGKVEIQAERTITPVQDKSGRITGWLCVYRDITEQLRLEKIQEDLTRMLVHDLRSPIVSIQGGLDMIEVMIEDNDPKSLLDMVELSRNGCTRMLGMINQLLNVTQLEAGELTIQLKSVNFPAICEEESRRFSPIINREKLNLVQNFPTNFPTIRGDIELLRRVVHNIIDNATKYSPNGSKIEIWGKPDPQNSDYVLIGVKDQGPGIKENEHDFLFEKYFTSQQEKSRRRGTGLGLYFCKLAVEAHHGIIWVESKIGQGSNFIIRIPCRQGNEP
jgi:PAS domain S-box-containing protein